MNDTTMTLEQIDELFSNHLSELEKIISDCHFSNSFEFVLDENSNYSELLGDLNYSGIYLIEIKINKTQSFSDWVDNYRNIWEAEEYKRRFVPNIKIKRLKKHDKLSEWFPLYIGKSKDISKRIKEHMELKLERNTNALKLKERKNIYDQKFRVSAIKVNVKNYDLIVPQFENLLRERLNPILGRK